MTLLDTNFVYAKEVCPIVTIIGADINWKTNDHTA
jgi:hypothetical protein